MARWRSTVHIVKPETIVAWHCSGFRLFWTWKSRHRNSRSRLCCLEFSTHFFQEREVLRSLVAENCGLRRQLRGRRLH